MEYFHIFMINLTTRTLWKIVIYKNVIVLTNLSTTRKQLLEFKSDATLAHFLFISLQSNLYMCVYLYILCILFLRVYICFLYVYRWV